MLKKIRIALLFMVIISIFALFVATELIAQTIPESCTITTNGGPLTIEAIKRNGEFPFITISSDNEFPCPCPDPNNPACPPDNKCYVFAYEVFGHDADEIPSIFGLFPRCINLIGAGGLSPLPPENISPPCDDNSLWPDVCSGYQAKLPLVPISDNKAKLYFFTTVAEADVMDLGLNSRMFCKDGIIGTACGEEPGGIAASSVRECTNNLGSRDVQGDEAHYWYYRNSDAQGCLDQTKDFIICAGLCPDEFLNESGPCTPPLEPSQVAEHVLASSLNPQTCDDEAVNTTFSAGNPHYLYEVWSGGYYWRGCLNLATYQWDPITCCTSPGSCGP